MTKVKLVKSILLSCSSYAVFVLSLVKQSEYTLSVELCLKNKIFYLN